MSKLLYIASFTVGALTGFAVTRYIMNKKTEQILQKEIKSVTEAFDRRLNEITVTETNSLDDNLSDAMDEKYETIVKKYNGDWKEKVMFVISPEMFGGENGYKLVSLTYYSDGVLADDSGNKIDIDDTVGQDSLKTFGDYVDDAVYVRNIDDKTDYEILLDPSTYSEVYEDRD